ncbi:MAG TPA: sulfite exporter TauE/SafE family protein [Candidatus Limnocylindrales bacterium]|nr:sulfite exporter TauE/SafE family protein [Candidatus Limnocylindrales bacterium]
MMTIFLIVLLSLAVGVLVGLLGIGGGVVLVPALVYLLHYDQHMAQGTSLLILLPPIGLGALREYWKNDQVDLRAGIYCALGFLVGGYGGGKMAVPMPSNVLKAVFGCFLMMSAVLLWRKTRAVDAPDAIESSSGARSPLGAFGIFCAAGICGIAAGMVGIGGGVLLVPLLSLLFGFSQHRAQGTSLIALIPPTGLLAFLAYWKAGYVDLHTGLLLIPGVFIGGILGGMMARRLNARRMAEVFAGLMMLLGGWQVFSAWRG